MHRVNSIECIMALHISKYLHFVSCAGGCRTYRKTLAEKSKHAATPIKKKKLERSRKQRVSEVPEVFLCTHSEVLLKYYLIYVGIVLSFAIDISCTEL